MKTDIPQWYHNSATYYRWWATRVGINYLTSEDLTSFLVKMVANTRSQRWFVAAAKKQNKLQTPETKKASNHEARILARESEEIVTEFLHNRGWEILVEPTLDLYPKFGTSTSGYDLVIRKDQVMLKVEVKVLQPDAPLFTISDKAWRSIQKADTDVLAMVKGGKVYFALVDHIKFLDPVYMHDAINYPQDKAMVYLNVIDPSIFKTDI